MLDFPTENISLFGTVPNKLTIFLFFPTTALFFLLGMDKRKKDYSGKYLVTCRNKTESENLQEQTAAHVIGPSQDILCTKGLKPTLFCVRKFSGGTAILIELTELP